MSLLVAVAEGVIVVKVKPVGLAHSVLVVAVPGLVPAQVGVFNVTVTFRLAFGVKPLINKLLVVTKDCEPVPAPVQATLYWPEP
jgi:hypothetical protein